MRAPLGLLIGLLAAVPVWRGAAVAAESTIEATQGSGVDKSIYTLLNPTPDRYLRELSADRPDKTDSPYTVDAGHYQLEMDVINFVYDHYNPEKAHREFRAFEAGSMNLKAGLLNNVDAQLVLVAYRAERVADRAAGTLEHDSGFGDLTPRLKINLWGNDGGRTALGVMPFVKLPTAHHALSNHEVEGGIKVPLAIEVPNWDVSLMTEVDWLHDDPGSGYHPEFVNTISVGRRIVGALSLYCEFYSAVRTEAPSDWAGTVDTWLTYEVTRDLRLDGGVYIGVTRAAEDWHPFVGLTWRH